jgi:lipopolysaccharide assembly outer membrane protein LptD (OstA)
MSTGFKLSTKRCIYLVSIALVLCISQCASGQDKTPKADGTDTSHKKPGDTTLAKKNRKDTLTVPVSSSALPSEVKYKAKDSIIFDIENKSVYLYGKEPKMGKAHMDYTDIKLDASFIRIDYLTNTIFAKSLPDSTGKPIGKPIFAQGSELTNSDSMAYNFKTKKGKVYTLLTAEGEGFVHVEEAKISKIDGKDVIYAHNGKYTTCNLPENPHYYLASNKMKLMPGDKVITGPAWIVIEGVPLPIVLPFGFFPASSRKTSGIILPAYGESPSQGFVLRGGGYYFGGNEHYDAAITGDIYTKGSYKLEMRSRYKQIYKYGGDFDLSYAKNQYGEAGDPTFNKQENYQISWTHNTDPKASPGSSFRASVNAATPGFYQKNEYTNLTALYNQTLSSSISYNKQFLNSPFNLSIAMRHSQNLGTHAISFDLPNASFTMNRITPFKSKTETKKHWYDEIGISYSTNFINKLSTTDTNLRRDIIDPTKYRSGFDNEIPISASFNVLKYFTLTPSINNSIFIYDKRYQSEDFKTFYDPLRGKNIDTIVTNVSSGLYVAHTHSASLALGTTIYGMYKFKNSSLVALRHVMTPSVTAVYSPDYSAPQFGYYGNYISTAYGTRTRYSYFTAPDGSSVVQPPTQGRQGALNFVLHNNFEAKVKTKKDTTKSTKKVMILESLDFSTGYNFLGDSLKLTPVSINAHTTLFEKLVVQGGAVLDPYYWDKFGREHKDYDWDVEHKIGRISTANLSLNTSLNHKPNEKGTHPIQQSKNPFVYYNYPQPYASFDVPWNVSLGYNANYNGINTVFVNNTPSLSPVITHSLSVNGDINITKNWKIIASSGYDFTTKKAISTRIQIFRDLHCWTMSFDWVPYGAYRSYFFSIHIKASTLQDLKLDKRKEYYDF